MNKTISKLCLSGLGLLSTGLAYSQETTVPKTSNKPNIIYILADDLGYGDLGCYGQKEIKTPQLDKMANQGMLFTNHYAGAPVSAPSRCSLLTGKHTGQAYIRGNKEYYPNGQEPLAQSETTFAKVLQDDSYKTALIGKWGLGMNDTVGDPLKHGFDSYYGYLCQRAAHNYYPATLYRNGVLETLPTGTHSHNLFTQEAISFLKDNKDENFFLYLAYTLPHARLQVDSIKPYNNKRWIASKKKYAAMVTLLDRDVGRILDLLKDLNIAENTLVFFASDNGPHMEGGANPSYFNSSGGLRGFKRSLHEGGIRVPMIAWWPGTIEKGQKTDLISSFQDIFPTVTELTGNKTPEGLTGVSLAPLLLGDKKNIKQNEYLYWEYPGMLGARAVRMGYWKGIENNVASFLPNKFELYNLKSDPEEKINLVNEYPEIVEQLREIMSKARVDSEKFPVSK